MHSYFLKVTLNGFVSYSQRTNGVILVSAYHCINGISTPESGMNQYAFRPDISTVQKIPNIYTVSRKKEATVFFLHNFNKCRHSFVIFGVNHHKDSFY